MPLLRQRNLQAIRCWLLQRLASQGLRQFVSQTVTQANIDIDRHAWERGELARTRASIYRANPELVTPGDHEMYADPQPPRGDADYRAGRATCPLGA